MAKEIILYNLADHVTDEQYQDFVKKVKGPTIASLPAVKKYQLIRIKGAETGEVPFNYVGVVDVDDLDALYQRDKKTQKFQDLLAKMMPMFKNIHILYGEEVY